MSWQDNMAEGNHLADLRVGGRIILKWMPKKQWGHGWIHLAEHRDKCLAVVNAVMNLRVP
jgi:hypothetical protein